jgi:hypothetical protein
MGQIIKATCSTCHYENEFSFGGTRFSNGANHVPALNLKTGVLKNVNYCTHKHDVNHVFYVDRLLKSSTGEELTLLNGNLEINRVGNYCPGCANYTLDFMLAGFFD